MIVNGARVEETPHFRLHFRMRNLPPGVSGQGAGLNGLRNQFLVAYLTDALELLYKCLTNPPFLRKALLMEDGGITVLIFDSPNPYATLDLDGVPYICLPSRSQEPMLQNALHRIAVEAVHEATHVFNWSARPPLRSYFERRWYWFNEATAVYTEGVVYPGNLDSIRFYLDWSDLPELPLDHKEAEYFSGMFARYLAQKFEPHLISRLWQESAPDEGPLDALRRLTKEAQSTAIFCHLFGDYAHDSYFLWDSRLASFHPDVYLRFGSRAVAENFVLAPGREAHARWTLDRLACRYFRIDVGAGVNELRATVTVPAAVAGQFRCFLSVNGRDNHRGEVAELKVTGNPVALETTLSAPAFRDADHIVLTVANCGTRALERTPIGRPHDDGREFEVQLAAH